MSTRSVLWFRKGLRVHDNPALQRACEGASAVMPVFVLDPWFMSPERVGANRVRFLLESLRDLDETLQSKGSKLVVVHGNPTEVIPAALERWQCTRLCFETDTEPYAKTRDAAVVRAAKEAGVEVHAPSSHTLYDVERLLAKCPKGEPPTAYGTFLKIAASLGDPPKPVPTPDTIPGTIPGDVASLVSQLGSCATGHGIPTLEDLGYPALPRGEGFPAAGGETEGLRRLRATLAAPAYVAEFKKPSTSPTQMWQPADRAFASVKGAGSSGARPANPFEAAKRGGGETKIDAAALFAPSTTALSPYMKFGCVSARTFYHELHAVLRGLNGKHSKPPESLEGQLLWREFYYLAAAGTPNYDKMEGNRICRQIPWSWDSARLAAWEEGRTGFPWIDACMMQLRKEGWMHHLSRHAVACFLTRGDLFVHWEAGAAVFDRDLVDADWALNNGNWMWLSCSCFFYQYFRVYGPVSFGKKYDKNGDFIRHYLPQLRNMPAKYIYEPWLAPLDVQKKAGCVVGEDYPPPMVDHAAASKECIEKLAAAYKAHKEGKGGTIKAEPRVGAKRKAE
jgi:cryptochrome